MFSTASEGVLVLFEILNDDVLHNSLPKSLLASGGHLCKNRLLKVHLDTAVSQHIYSCLKK